MWASGHYGDIQRAAHGYDRQGRQALAEPATCLLASRGVLAFVLPNDQEIMQNLNERACMQNLILNHMHKGYYSDDEQNRSSSGSSSQRSLGSCSRAAFG